jgi:hypothetical protein
MKIHALELVCFALSITLAPGAMAQGKGKGGGGGGKCTDVPIRVTLLPTLPGEPPSAFRGDGVSDTYQDGQDHVSASIHFCSSTYDATITTYRSSRKIRISFPQPLPDSSLSGDVPSFAGGEVEVDFFFNIRNILCVTGTCGDTFTTHMNWQLYFPDAGYRLRFYPSVTDSPDLHSPDMLVDEPDINMPHETSYVVVHHRPGDCASGGNTYDQWDISGVNPNSDGGTVQLGTLHNFASKPRDPVLHLGQYSMPYRLQVEALQCFSTP